MKRYFILYHFRVALFPTAKIADHIGLLRTAPIGQQKNEYRE